MNFKLILISLIAFYTFNTLSGQRSRVDIENVINRYERQYRIILNESDFDLITDQLNEIGCDCDLLENILHSNLYSTNYKIALLDNFKKWKDCPLIILDHINLSVEKEENEMSMPDFGNLDYPIYDKILQKNRYHKHFADYITESDYLESCTFMLNHGQFQKLKMLWSIIKDSNFESLNKQSCKYANLIIMKGMSK